MVTFGFSWWYRVNAFAKNGWSKVEPAPSRVAAHALPIPLNPNWLNLPRYAWWYPRIQSVDTN